MRRGRTLPWGSHFFSANEAVTGLHGNCSLTQTGKERLSQGNTGLAGMGAGMEGEGNPQIPELGSEDCLVQFDQS